MYDENNNELNNGVGNETTSSTEGLNKTVDPSASNNSNVGGTPGQNTGYRGYDYGQGTQPYAGGAYSGQNPNTYAGRRPTYGAQPQNMYGAQNQNPYGARPQSPYGAQMQNPYGASNQNPYMGQGAYTAPTSAPNPANYGGYSRAAQNDHEQTSTGSAPTPTAFGGFTSEPVRQQEASQTETATDTQSQTQRYGTYQYSTGDSTAKEDKAPKKKNPVMAVIAAVAVVALIVTGIGSAYFLSRNNQQTQQQAAIEEKEPEAPAVQDNVTDNPNNKTVAATNTDTIKTTTTSGQTMAVVTDVTAVVQEVMPALVMIHNNYTVSNNYFGYMYQNEATASGSGIIVGQNDAELLIATNYHVIEGADTLEVIFSDDATIEAVVKGTASDMDLAVIAVSLDSISSETLDTIKIATLGDSDGLLLGEPCVAIGNALGYGQSVTTGVISALNREVEISEGVTRTFIQTDAAINPGNSGGALLNLQGEVIGINSNKLGGDTVEGMGYAIPISSAQPIIEKLMNEQTKLKVAESERGYIGISGVSVTSDVTEVYGLPQGVYVAEAPVGGGAEAAGIQKGDVIVAFDGEEITSMEDLTNRLQYYAAGTTVDVTIKRSNGSEYEEITYQVTLGASKKNGGSGKTSGGDSNGANGQYDGQQMPGMPEDRNNGQSGSQGGGH